MILTSARWILSYACSQYLTINIRLSLTINMLMNKSLSTCSSGREGMRFLTIQ